MPNQRLISNSSDRFVLWDRRQLHDSLVTEARLPEEQATLVLDDVEEDIIKLGALSGLRTSMVRDFVLVALARRGYMNAYKRYKKLGVSFYDVLQKYLPKGIVPGGKLGDGAGSLIVGRAKKEFALDHLFSDEVVRAHVDGDLHIHGLETFDTLYSSHQSLEFLKRFGLDLHHRLPASKPATEPEQLVSQLSKFSHSLKQFFHGPIGWDGVNIFFSTYLERVPDTKVYGYANALIHEMAQQSYNLSDTVNDVDFHLYWEVPQHLEAVVGTGAGGKRAKKTYKEYTVESQRFLWALFDTYRHGDSFGQPYFTPRPVLHITERFFKTSGAKEFLKLLAKVAGTKATINFVFDRGTTLINHCGRFNLSEGEDFLEATEPWKMRYHSFQNVVINLPRVGYKAQGDANRVLSEIQALLEMAIQTHLAKKQFIFRLLNRGRDGPLGLLTRKHVDRPYLRADRLVYLVSFVGLNELVQTLFGSQLHEDEATRKRARQILRGIAQIARKLGERHEIRVVIDEVPTNAARYRFAALDLAAFPVQAQKVVKGEPAAGIPHYTNSAGLAEEAAVAARDRIRMEGDFHEFLNGGALTTINLGAQRPKTTSLMELIHYAYHETKCEQLSFSADFTRCFTCDQVTDGLVNDCRVEGCASSKVDGITKQAGSLTWLSSIEEENLFDLLQRYDHPELSEG